MFVKVQKVQNSNLQLDVSSETIVFRNTQLKIILRRMMNARCIYRKYSTSFRARLHHLANRYVLKRENLGPTLGVIQTGSATHRNAKAPTFEEISIELTLHMEEMARNSAWIFHKNVHTIPGSFFENQHKLFKPSPESNVSSPCMTTSKERAFIVDSEASLRMMSKSDVTPEEQEANQKRSISYCDCKCDDPHDRRSNSMCP